VQRHRPKVTKEQLVAWRNHPVSQALIKAALSRIEEAKDQIVGSTDPDFDRIIKGVIRGHSEHLDVYFDDDPEIIEIVKELEIEES
jgi:hypothetical protein